LGVSSRSANDETCVLLIRAQGLLVALANILLAGAALRRLFPGKVQTQCIGLLLAAFVAPQFYLSQYVTNELLAATLVTTSFYLCLRLLQSSESSVLGYIALGACLGLALLTKVSAVLAIPFVVA